MLSQLTHKEYLKVTIPFMLSTATQPLLGAVNTAVMGHMSEAFYIAAVSLGVILFNNIYWLFGFLRVSTTSFSAQALGSESAKDKFLLKIRLAISSPRGYTEDTKKMRKGRRIRNGDLSVGRSRLHRLSYGVRAYRRGPGCGGSG